MIDLIKNLCLLDGVSSGEDEVRKFIISQIKDYCDFKVDPLGNIIVHKKGKKRAQVKLMVDAHMDEVGFIITSITDEGFLKFKTVGGIETSVLMFKKVRINNSVLGAISGKPIHLLEKSQREKCPDSDSLYIDIGAKTRDEAEQKVSVGDLGVICGEFETLGENIVSKAIDDRIGCAILIKLLQEDFQYDFYASFSVEEEIGLRGARTATFGINPESAIVLEATTASDISGVDEENFVCRLSDGPAVSFMDRATVYDKKYYNAALSSGIKCQPKCAVAGGNNSGAVHLSREGVRTLAISVPCRYIHSASCVANIEDAKNAYNLARYMISGICSGEIK